MENNNKPTTGFKGYLEFLKADPCSRVSFIVLILALPIGIAFGHNAGVFMTVISFFIAIIALCRGEDVLQAIIPMGVCIVIWLMLAGVITDQ